MHCISGYVGKLKELKDLSLPATTLPQGFGFVCSEEIKQKDVDQLSKAVYVQTDYFGGAGTQSAAFSRKGKVSFEVYESWGNPIDKALKMLGVKCDEGKDEFDSINLGKYRSNEDFGYSTRY